MKTQSKPQPQENGTYQVAIGITVEPLLSGHLLRGQLSKSRNYFQLNTISKTPIKRPPKIKYVWFGFVFDKAMNLAEQLRHFAQFHGHQKLALSLATSNDLIYALKLLVPKPQTSLQDFFK